VRRTKGEKTHFHLLLIISLLNNLKVFYELIGSKIKEIIIMHLTKI